jgi:amino acid adenylation domain-containing protein
VNTLDLLSQLRNLDVHLWADGDRLRYDARQGVLTPALIQEIAARKMEILKLLSDSAAPDHWPPVIMRRPASEHPPLSFAQQRIWFMDQLAPGNPFFNINMAIKLPYRIEPLVFQRALNEIIRRHESLRTTFGTFGDEPVQIIAPELQLGLPVIDLSHRPKPEREMEAVRLSTEESRHPFDLSVGPLIRTTLICLDREDWVFLLTIHHIVTDGWSMGIFFKELSDIYAAFATGRPSTLPELPIQYGDYAMWQRRWLHGEVLARQLAYWTDRLTGIPALDLPIDHPRPAVQTFRGADHTFMIPATIALRLKALSRGENATLFMTLLAAFKALLFRYTGQNDIVVGSYIANRNRKEVESLIGFFVNTLVFRTNVSGDPTFRDLLSRIRETSLGAYTHQDIPFTKLVEELQPDRNLDRNPLFQVVFQLFNAPTVAQCDTPLGSSSKGERGTAIFDLALHTWEGPGGLHAQFEYNTDLLDRPTILRMALHFQALLQAIANDPDERISTLPLLGEDERRKVIGQWNQTQRTYPHIPGLVGLFEACVEAHSNTKAFSCDGECLTYAELNRRANQLAHRLRALGMQPGEAVGVCIDRSLDLPVALIAIFKAEGVYLPLDPTYPKDRLAHCLRDAGASFLLVKRHLRDLIPSQGKIVIVDEPFLAPDENRSIDVDPDATAYLIYTSGSTGTPKGVMVPHRQILNRLHWMWEAYPFQCDEVACQKTALNFVDSLWELLGALLKGVPTVIVPDAVLKDVYALVDFMGCERVTRLWVVPSLLRAILSTYNDLQRRLPDLRFWVASGEALPSELFDRFRRILPNATLYNLYGTSEAWDITWWDPAGIAETPWRIPIGKPIANMRTYVLDTGRQPVPVGVAGELFVGGVGLADGYINRADVNAKQFFDDPFAGQRGARMYRTGDLARWLPDGNLEFLGRTDDQVKVRGHRIELGDIESVASRHPAIKEAAAVVRLDDMGENRLFLYVVPGREASARRDDEDTNTPLYGWRDVWNNVYTQEPPHQDTTFNTTGFVSSYTDGPIPKGEVQEWVDEAVEHVQALAPRHVLEIGCGVGLLLFRIAPHCQSYFGTDLAEAAITYLRHQSATRTLPGVELRHQAADDFTKIPDDFDLVILHSIVQYFPNVDYLVRVLEGAVQSVRAGGAVFIGDVRSLHHAPAFYASVEIERAAPTLLIAELQRRVQRRAVVERELLVSPQFFAALPEQIPAIRHVTIEPKRGSTPNEFTSFRYNVILHTGTPTQLDPEMRWVDWDGERLSAESLQSQLDKAQPAQLAITNVLNPVSGLCLAKLIDGIELDTTVRALREAMASAAPAGLSPAKACAIARRSGYNIALRLNPNCEDRYDLLLRRGADGALIHLPVQQERAKPWHTYTNHPALSLSAHALTTEIRSFLQEHLPEHMVPSIVIPMDELPLTPSGKVNRRALPNPDSARPKLEKPYVAPRSPLEEEFCRNWGEILGLKLIGIHDHFFSDLGGHSLLATRVVSQIRDKFAVEISLRTFFENPTVAAIATAVQRLKDGSKDSAPATIGRARREQRVVRIDAGLVQS